VYNGVWSWEIFENFCVKNNLTDYKFTFYCKLQIKWGAGCTSCALNNFVAPPFPVPMCSTMVPQYGLSPEAGSGRSSVMVKLVCPLFSEHDDDQANISVPDRVNGRIPGWRQCWESCWCSLEMLPTYNSRLSPPCTHLFSNECQYWKSRRTSIEKSSVLCMGPMQTFKFPFPFLAAQKKKCPL